MNLISVFSLMLLSGILAGCVTKSSSRLQASEEFRATLGAPSPAKPSDTSDSSNPDDKSSPPVSIVRYVGWDAKGWKPGRADTPPSNNMLADLYTRFELYSDQEVGGSGGATTEIALRAYDKENRGWFARLIQSETDTVTTLLNVEIKDPELKVAIPLFSITHASGRDLGNTWATNFTQSYVESPLFLIGPDTAVVIHLKAEASAELKSQAAAAIIGAVTQAVQIAAPASSLLTKLSKPEINNTASAIDTTISNLFSKDQTEDVELGRFADTWSKDNNSFVVTGCAPFVRFDGFGDGRQCSGKQDPSSLDAKVGSWRFTMRCPQVSVFSADALCEPTERDIDDKKSAIAANVTDSDILKYFLSSQVTIIAFMKAQSWYTTFINKSKKLDDDYGSFCVSLMTDDKTGLPATGLSHFDSALALRAIVHTLSMSGDMATGFSKNKSCTAMLSQGNTHVTLAVAR